MAELPFGCPCFICKANREVITQFLNADWERLMLIKSDIPDSASTIQLQRILEKKIQKSREKKEEKK